jgi:hypothetical protein
MTADDDWDESKNPQSVIVFIEEVEIVEGTVRLPGWYWGMSWVADPDQDLIDLPEFDPGLDVLNGPLSSAEEAEVAAQSWWGTSGDLLPPKRHDA